LCRRGRIMFRPMRWLFIATAFAPTAAAAQLQVNQNFVTQGPSPSFGLTSTVQSGDAPPNGNVAGAIGPVVALDANTLFVGTPAGGIWKTTNGGTSWTPLTEASVALDRQSFPRSRRPDRQDFDRGHGSDRQWDGLFNWGVLLYRFRRPAGRTLVLARWR